MRIDIYCAFCERITDPALLARYRQVLTQEERGRQLRFYFQQDRHRYLITRALLRTTLSRYADIAPEQWAFLTNAHARPYVSNQGVNGLTFNLSHTRKLVVLAVTRGGELGIDTEDTVTRTPPLEIADRCFAPEEVTSLRALPAEQRVQRFFQHWTLQDADENWRLWQWWVQSAQARGAPGEQHMLALCAQRVADAPPELVLREI